MASSVFVHIIIQFSLTDQNPEFLNCISVGSLQGKYDSSLLNTPGLLLPAPGEVK